jgi:hypothetical protein
MIELVAVLTVPDATTDPDFEMHWPSRYGLEIFSLGKQANRCIMKIPM